MIIANIFNLLLMELIVIFINKYYIFESVCYNWSSNASLELKANSIQFVDDQIVYDSETSRGSIIYFYIFHSA